MEALTVVVLANAIAWLGIGGYLAFITLSQRRLAQRLALLESAARRIDG
ncbi:MAG: CcmD family protein [Desulfovibrio sp.]|jgi:CcmD family protein|nr:CcmD family protein [Desulfovibrio sp.]